MKRSGISPKWKHVRIIVFITVALFILFFLLLPQFSGFYRKFDRIKEEFERTAPEVKKDQKISPTATADYTDPVTGMEFVFVKGGCFDMGDIFGNGQPDEKPVHRVCLDDFYIGKYEVTVAQWNTVMMNPSRYSKQCRGNNCPVERVSWELARAFIRTLNQKSGRNYRLPTEAEWEYAARSGGKREKWAGTSNLSLLGNYAWYDKNSGGRVHPVGEKKPNAIGLYDMSGNVWEWVADWYDPDYYSRSAQNNPKGPESGTHKVQRGGSWFFDSWSARTCSRNERKPKRTRQGWDMFGFRLAMTP